MPNIPLSLSRPRSLVYADPSSYRLVRKLRFQVLVPIDIADCFEIQPPHPLVSRVFLALEFPNITPSLPLPNRLSRGSAVAYRI